MRIFVDNNKITDAYKIEICSFNNKNKENIEISKPHITLHIWLDDYSNILKPIVKSSKNISMIRGIIEGTIEKIHDDTIYIKTFSGSYTKNQ